MTELSPLEARIETLETRVAYQEHTIEALNQALTAQWKEIDRLTRELVRLGDRLAAAENAIPASPGDEPPPPHY
ncbi:MAG: SlyX family protein [Afipia sp.]|nr:SlyX family protein [Afipia sp.]